MHKYIELENTAALYKYFKIRGAQSFSFASEPRVELLAILQTIWTSILSVLNSCKELRDCYIKHLDCPPRFYL